MTTKLKIDLSITSRVSLFGFASMGIFISLYGLYIIFRSYSPSLYSDYWSTVPLYDAWLRGTLTIDKLHAQFNEHRLLVPRLFYLADYTLFSGTQTLNFAIIVLTNVTHALAIGWMVSRASPDRTVPAVFTVLCVALMLSPAQFENLTWSFQVPFVQVYFFATVAFCCVAGLQAATGLAQSLIMITGACVAAFLSTYSMVNGLAVWPVMIVLAFLLRLDLVYGIVIFVVATFAVALYMNDLTRTNIGGHGLFETLSDPITFGHFVLQYLAVPFKYLGDEIEPFIGAAVLLVTAGTGLTALLRPSRYSRWQLALAAIAGFVLCAALLTALGRAGYYGVERGVSKRYSTPVIVLYAALIGFHLSNALRRVDGGQSTKTPIALLGTATAIAIASTAIYQPRLERWLGKIAGREEAMLAYVAGARPKHLLDLIGPFWEQDDFDENVAILKREHLSIFTDPRFSQIPPRSVVAEGVPSCDIVLASYTASEVVGTVVSARMESSSSGDRGEWLVVADGRGTRVAYGLSDHIRDVAGKSVAFAYGPVSPKASKLSFALVSTDGSVTCVDPPAPVPDNLR